MSEWESSVGLGSAFWTINKIFSSDFIKSTNKLNNLQVKDLFMHIEQSFGYTKRVLSAK